MTIIWPTENDVIVRKSHSLRTLKYMLHLGTWSSVVVATIYLALREFIIPNFEKLLEQRSEIKYHTLVRLRKILLRAKNLVTPSNNKENEGLPEQPPTSKESVTNALDLRVNEIKSINRSYGGNHTDINSLQAAFSVFNENLQNLIYKTNKDNTREKTEYATLVSDLRAIKGQVIKDQFK